MGVYKQQKTRSFSELIASSVEIIPTDIGGFFHKMVNLKSDSSFGNDFSISGEKIISEFEGYVKVFGRIVYPPTSIYQPTVSNFGCSIVKNGSYIRDTFANYRFASNVNDSRILMIQSGIGIVKCSPGDAFTLHANHQEPTSISTYYVVAGQERTGFYVERM